MKKIVSSAAALTAYMVCQSAVADVQVKSLSVLQDKCAEAARYSQSDKNLVSSFKCSAVREVYAVGKREYKLPNHRKLSYALNIKGKNQSPFHEADLKLADQRGSCPTIQKVTISVNHTENLGCEELNKVQNEQEYCSAAVSQVLDECVKLVENGEVPFKAPVGSKCKFAVSGDPIVCAEASSSSSVETASETGSSDAEHAKSGHRHRHHDKKDKSAKSSVSATATVSKTVLVEMNAAATAEKNFGAQVQVTTYADMIGFHHRAIKVVTAPAAGSVLEAMNLRQGSIVKSVGGHRVKSVKGFVDRIKKAQADGKVKLSAAAHDPKAKRPVFVDSTAQLKASRPAASSAPAASAPAASTPASAPAAAPANDPSAAPAGAPASSTAGESASTPSSASSEASASASASSGK